ncbi:hypothetical protein Tcan_00728, partial [Toxocara canis]
NAYVIPKIRLFLPITATATKKDLKVLQRVAKHSIGVIHNLKKLEKIIEHKAHYSSGDISKVSSTEFKVVDGKMQNGQLSENLNNVLTKITHNRTRCKISNKLRTKNHQEIPNDCFPQYTAAFEMNSDVL